MRRRTLLICFEKGKSKGGGINKMRKGEFFDGGQIFGMSVKWIESIGEIVALKSPK